MLVIYGVRLRIFFMDCAGFSWYSKKKVSVKKGHY